MTTRKIASAVAATTLLGFSLSACDSADPSAQNVAASAKKNATSAKSTSMAISGSVQGQTVTMNASGTLDGKNQHQVQSASKLKSEEYIVNNTAYFKANSDFLTANGMNAAQSKTLADKWWSKPLGGNAQSASANVKALVDQFFSSDDGKKLASANADVKETTTRGQETYTMSDPKNPDGAKLVTTRGKSPQLVQIENYASALTQNTKATYTFTQWNAVPMFQAPAGAKPLPQTSPTQGSSGQSSSSAPSTPAK